MAVGGILSNSQLGWPSVFYIFGGLGVVWGLPWYFLAHNLPEHHPRISDAELSYILKHRTYVTQEKVSLEARVYGLHKTAVACSPPVF